MLRPEDDGLQNDEEDEGDRIEDVDHRIIIMPSMRPPEEARRGAPECADDQADQRGDEADGQRNLAAESVRTKQVAACGVVCRNRAVSPIRQKGEGSSSRSTSSGLRSPEIGSTAKQSSVIATN